MTETSVVEPLQVNDRCQVKWRGGVDTLDAVVVARRCKGHRKRKKNGSVFDLSSLRADELEYYVHYVEHDRRLDEWITVDKFEIDTLQRHGTVEDPEDLSSDRLLRSRSSASVPENVAVSTSNNAEAPSTVNYATNANTAGESMVEPFRITGGNWRGGNSSDPSLAEYEREHDEATKVKNIEKILMGEWEVMAWYYSPFPDAYSDLETLFVCEYCLTYMRKVKTYRKHRAECQCRHPPGKEIYREGELSVYEIDGKDHRAYCQKLCLLAKLFLEHKTLFFDVMPFMYYVVTKVDSRGAHIVGYFSKEKVSTEGYNLACILTFPQYQQCGYGKFIISLSYELTKREGKTGSPEKPLSDLGKVSYRSYWTHVLMHLLGNHAVNEDITISDISTRTGIRTEDLISTLQSLDMIKVWKGQHVIYVKQDIIRDYMRLGGYDATGRQKADTFV